MDVVLTKSKKPDKKNTMPELMALKLLILVRRVLQTSPNIKIQIEKKDT